LVVTILTHGKVLISSIFIHSEYLKYVYIIRHFTVRRNRDLCYLIRIAGLISSEFKINYINWKINTRNCTVKT